MKIQKEYEKNTKKSYVSITYPSSKEYKKNTKKYKKNTKNLIFCIQWYSFCIFFVYKINTKIIRKKYKKFRKNTICIQFVF